MGLFFERFVVEGNSMEPALRAGDHVWICRILKGKVGDVVVLKKNAKTMVKRIIRVEDGHYTVHGDHRSVSTDSEHFGSVQRTHIRGKVIVRIPSNRKP